MHCRSVNEVCFHSLPPLAHAKHVLPGSGSGDLQSKSAGRGKERGHAPCRAAVPDHGCQPTRISRLPQSSAQPEPAKGHGGPRAHARAVRPFTWQLCTARQGHAEHDPESGRPRMTEELKEVGL